MKLSNHEILSIMFLVFASAFFLITQFKDLTDIELIRMLQATSFSILCAILYALYDLKQQKIGG